MGEVLRQASVALGRTVTLYEASETGDLVPRASSSRHPGYHEANNPLAAARAGLQLAAETVGRLAGLDAAARRDLLTQLAEVEEAVDRTIDFMRAVADRARGTRTGPERFDVVGAVRSAVALE